MVSLAVAGAYLFGVYRIQAIWGLPVVPNSLFAIWAVCYVPTRWRVSPITDSRFRAKARVRLALAAILAAIVAILSIVLLAVGLALPQTALGDVFSFQIVTALADSIGGLGIRYMTKSSEREARWHALMTVPTVPTAPRKTKRSGDRDYVKGSMYGDTFRQSGLPLR